MFGLVWLRFGLAKFGLAMFGLEINGIGHTEARRARGDLIQLYKVMTGTDNVSPSTWFKNKDLREGATSTRSVNLTHSIPRPNTLYMKEPRLHFWATRCVDPWNSLPDYIKTARSVNEFKEKYDEWMNSRNEDRRPASGRIR